MKKTKYLLILPLLMHGIGCSKSSDSSNGGAGNSKLITSTFSEVNTQAAKVAKIADADLTTSNVTSQDVGILSAPNFGNFWSTTDATNDVYDNSGYITIKKYMGYQLNPDAKRTNGSYLNVFGRMKNALAIFCAVGVATQEAGVPIDSAGYPTNGQHTVTFTAALKASMNTTCGISPDNIPDGTAMTLTVEDSGGTLYVKKFSFDVFKQVYFVKMASDEINITTAETTDSGGVSRTIVAWNKSTNVMKVEYNSLQGTANASSAGVYLYRLYFDETNDDGQILSTEGGSSDSSIKSIRYVLAGKPNTGDAFSISMIQDQDTATNHLNNGALTEACISSANGNVITDGSRCAETTSRTAGAAINQSSIVTLLGNYYSERTNTAWGTASASTTISWSSKTDMLTVDSAP